MSKTGKRPGPDEMDARRIGGTATEAQLVDGLPDEELVFHFVAGRPCLDFVATIGERWRRGFERLRTPDDLARWCVVSELVTARPEVTSDDLAAARQLRGAIARSLVTWGSGAPLPRDDVAHLNAVAALADLAPRLDPVTTRIVVAEPVSVSAVLATLARDTVRLIGEGEPGRLRECGADDCSLLFYDASRPGTRRWCSMRGCGNRHKTSQYRTRRASAR